jgi:uncharacterized protein YndB with AHSA1/START domain/uncharacterized damage-inducible protein DinB
MSVEQDQELTLRLERVIRARRERVYEALTEPSLLVRWSAPEGLSIREGEQDVRPGGAWRVVMVEPNGTEHEAFGVYRAVEPPARLVYTHAWRRREGSTPETEVTIDLTEEAGATRLVLTQVGFSSAGSRDGHVEGWTSTLERLERMLRSELAAPQAVLLYQWNLTRLVVGLNAADLSHEESLVAPQPGGNCANWIVGHLVAIYSQLLQLLESEPVLPRDVLARYARGSQPLASADEAVRFGELLGAWDETCRRVGERLEALSAERLSEPVPGSPTGNPDETLGSLLATVMFHQAYHAGQLGIVRRVAGKPGAVR